MDNKNTIESLSSNTSGLPAQKISINKKGDKWRRDTIDYFINSKNVDSTTTRSNRVRKMINYDLYNGQVNQADVQKICDPLGYTGNTWADRFQHYDNISEPLRLLIGDEISRPDSHLVISEAEDDINRKVKDLKQRILQSLEQDLMGAIDPSTIDPNNPPQTPEQVLKAESYSPSDMIEKKANKILKILKKKLNTKWNFTQGFKDALIAGEEIYWVGILNGEPALRKVNPLNITVILDDDSNFIDDAIAVVEQRMLSIPSILDEYGDDIDQADLNKLIQMAKSGYIGTSNTGTDDIVFNLSNKTTTTPLNSSNNNTSIRVVRVEWLSLKKVGNLSYTNPQTGELIQELVDETFSPIENEFKIQYPDATVEWYWINEAWEGTKIGSDIYVGIRPKPNQRRKMDNPFYSKLGYSGFIYEATNSRSVSLVDRLKPYQYLYDIIAFRLELAFASDQGKVFLMDLAQIPTSEGIDIEKWIYYLKELKIGFVNSFEEGKKGAHQQKLSTFNQFQAIDLSLANSIQQYINYLDYIKQQIYTVSGVSPQRMASISNKELVGNVEKSIEQSSVITEYLFEAHSEVKKRVYTALIEVAKIVWRNGKVMQFVNDDLGIEILELKEFEFENSDFSVFVSNMSKDREIKAKLDQLAQVALEQQKADLSTIIDTILNDSPKDIINTLRKSEENFYKRQEEQQKSEQEHAKELQQLQAEHEQRVWDHESSEKQLDREKDIYIADQNNATKIQVQELANYFQNTSEDLDQDSIPDPMEIANHALKTQDINMKHYLAENKQRGDKALKEKELAIKENEFKNKLDIENKKIEQIKIQNKNQIELANKKAKLDEKLMNQKMKLEAMKARAAIAKSKAKPKSTKKK